MLKFNSNLELALVGLGTTKPKRFVTLCSLSSNRSLAIHGKQNYEETVMVTGDILENIPTINA